MGSCLGTRRREPESGSLDQQTHPHGKYLVSLYPSIDAINRTCLWPPLQTGKNQPLKKERPKWKSDIILTEGQLRSKRDEACTKDRLVPFNILPSDHFIIAIVLGHGARLRRSQRNLGCFKGGHSSGRNKRLRTCSGHY